MNNRLFIYFNFISYKHPNHLMKFHTALGILKLPKWMRSNACSWTMVTSKLL